MFGPIWRLLMHYSARPDLQSAFPEVKEGNLNRLLNWAAYATQNLYDDKKAFDFLKQFHDFFYFASKYESFLPDPNFKNLPKLFFILGAGRSGTTLLKRIMCCHSLTAALEEGHVYHGMNKPILLKFDRIFESKKQWLGLKAPVLTDCLLDKNFVAFPTPGFSDQLSENFRKFYSNEPIIFLVRDVRDRVSSVIQQAKKSDVDLKGLSKLIENWIEKNPYIKKNFGEEISKIKKYDNKIFGFEALDWKIKSSAFFVYKEKGIPVLLVKYEDLRKEGKHGVELLKAGALDRLNPILMTAFTTGLALIPLALKGGEPGNEIQSPMAIVILGGLLSATLLNLMVIPCVYELVEKRRK